MVQRLSFDAWGKQRNPNGTAANCGTISAPTTRGFTNQEEMPTQCLVNLNARLYDPSIGKFIAADSVISAPYDGQNYNRYAYVTNNPLSLADPTGHEVESVTVSAARDNFNPFGSGNSLAAGAATLGANQTGLPSDFQQASNSTTSVQQPATANQQDVTEKRYQFRPPNLCSRAGGGANSACGGDYYSGFNFTVITIRNSSGQETISNANAQGSNASKGVMPRELAPAPGKPGTVTSKYGTWTGMDGVRGGAVALRYNGDPAGLSWVQTVIRFDNGVYDRRSGVDCNPPGCPFYYSKDDSITGPNFTSMFDYSGGGADNIQFNAQTSLVRQTESGAYVPLFTYQWGYSTHGSGLPIVNAPTPASPDKIQRDTINALPR